MVKSAIKVEGLYLHPLEKVVSWSTDSFLSKFSPKHFAFFEALDVLGA